MLKEGEIITLDNDEEYAVIQEVKLHEKTYFILMTVTRPISIKLCTFDGNEEITLIEDSNIIKEALLKLI